MVVLEVAHFFCIDSLRLFFLGLKCFELGSELLIAQLQLLLELVKTFRHAVLLEIGVKIARQLIQTSDSCSETLRCDTKLVLQSLLGSEQILLFGEKFGRLWVLISNLDPLRDFFLRILELLTQALIRLIVITR